MYKVTIITLFTFSIIFAQNDSIRNYNIDSINYYNLEEVVIIKKQNRTLFTLKSIKKQHKNIAGSTTVTLLEPQIQRLETLKDALKLEPGVIIQEFFGANDQPRLNIRGSGIQSNPQRRGVYLLQDDIPVNFADGSYIIGVMDPMVAKIVEVFKGANALKYGAATLGGAINFISRTGKNNPGLLIKSDIGSFQYKSLALMGGNSWKKLDFYTTLSLSQQRGARKQNKNRKLSFTTNCGFDINKNWKNRTYLNYSYINFDIPGPLTLEMIENDLSQISEGVKLPHYMGPDIARDRPSREVDMLRLSNKTTFKKADLEWKNTFYYQYADDRFVFPIVLSTQHSFHHDVGFSSFWKNRYTNHHLTAGLIGSYGIIYRNRHINKNGLDSFRFSMNKLVAKNISLLLEDFYMINDRWQATLSLQMVYNERNSKDIFPNPKLRPWYSHSSHKYRYFHSENISLNQNFKAFNPRIGFIYNANKKEGWQFFANVSKSYEPPTFDELIGTKITNNINTSPKKLFAIKLNQQNSWTTEIGMRLDAERYALNMALYKSWLNNEILEVKDFTLGIKTTKNYPYSIHEGLELGFKAIPLKYIFNEEDKDRIILQGVYNQSNFKFTSGEYKGHSLAGIPKKYCVGSLCYEYPELFSISLDVEHQPLETYVDHENTLQQPSFTLWGAKISYKGIKNITIYAEGKNITNMKYASGYIINDQIHAPPIPFPDFGAKNMTFFMPGTPASYYFGISYKL